MIYVDNVNMLVVTVGAIQKNAKSLVVAGRGLDWKWMLIKLNTWIGLVNRKQEEIIVKSSIMIPLKDTKS